MDILDGYSQQGTVFNFNSIYFNGRLTAHAQNIQYTIIINN